MNKSIKKELERLGSRHLNHIEVIAEVNGIEGRYKARELKNYPEAKFIRVSWFQKLLEIYNVSEMAIIQ